MNPKLYEQADLTARKIIGECVEEAASKIVRRLQEAHWQELCDIVDALGKLVPEAAVDAVGWARKVREERDTLREKVKTLEDIIRASHDAHLHWEHLLQERDDLKVQLEARRDDIKRLRAEADAATAKLMVADSLSQATILRKQMVFARRAFGRILPCLCGHPLSDHPTSWTMSHYDGTMSHSDGCVNCACQWFMP